MNFFIIQITYTKPIEAIEALMEPHVAFLDRFFEAGTFICSGPQSPRVGGIIICQAENKPEVATIVTEDPFYVNEVATYEITEFTPTKYSEDFKTMLDNL